MKRRPTRTKRTNTSVPYTTRFRSRCRAEGIRILPTASRESKARRDPMKPKKLDDGVLVSGQLRAADSDSAAQAGFKMIVNNRPDGEEPDQPASAELGERAEAQGIAYRHIDRKSTRLNSSH